MALGFVPVQKTADLSEQSRGYPGENFAQILMDGGFGDSEFLCCGSDGTAAFDHVHSQPPGAVIFVVMHRFASLRCVVTIQTMPVYERYSIDGWTGFYYNIYIYDTILEENHDILYQ
jgi:hypothetical protein